MSSEVVSLYRKAVPEMHKATLDTRLLWLWHQRFGTVQTVYTHSKDLLDVTAATLILQCVMAKDLKSIRLLFQRIEGAPLYEQEVIATSPAYRI